MRRRALAAIIHLIVVGVGTWQPFFVKWGQLDPWDRPYKVTGRPALVLFLLAASDGIFTDGRLELRGDQWAGTIVIVTAKKLSETNAWGNR